MTDPRTVIALRFTGGLGNQLFELAAALHLRDVIGVPVVIDRLLYSRGYAFRDPRRFEVDELPHGFTLIRGRGRSSRMRALPRAIHRRIVTRGARVISLDQAAAEARATTPLDPGARALIELSEMYPPWFESASTALANAPRLRTLFEARIPKAFQPEPDAAYIGVHSRLGDYLDPEHRGRLGPTDPAQLLELGQELSERHGGLPIRVFTDSPALFAHRCPESTTGPYVLSDASTSWDVLEGMARSHAFVMSNSTLSWWAAFIATALRDEPAEVLMAHPWWVDAEGTRAREELLVIPGWTRYERRLLPDSIDLSALE